MRKFLIWVVAIIALLTMSEISGVFVLRNEGDAAPRQMAPLVPPVPDRRVAPAGNLWYLHDQDDGIPPYLQNNAVP